MFFKVLLIWQLAANYKNTLFVYSFIEIFSSNQQKMERIFDAKTGEFALGFGLDNRDSGLAIYKRGAGNLVSARRRALNSFLLI